MIIFFPNRFAICVTPIWGVPRLARELSKTFEKVECTYVGWGGPRARVCGGPRYCRGHVLAAVNTCLVTRE